MSKSTQHPVALTARASLVPSALTQFDVAILHFPFMNAVSKFKDDIETTIHRGKRPESIPWRQLNNLLAACAPTLTYGFEWVSSDEANNLPARRALAVGTSNNPLYAPDTIYIHQMIRIWARQWTQQHSGKADSAGVSSRFLAAIEHLPSGWGWLSVPAEVLARDVNAEHGLGFHAIPSLLATLLHGTRCVLCGGRSEQEIHWRKVQGNGARPTGLYLVSQPFNALYVDQYGKEQEGYFAYRLDFHVETQAGRFNPDDTLNPWIFLHVSCQRYPHESMIQSNFSRDLSVLVGIDTNAPRMQGCTVDSTLVRLTG